MKLFNWIKNTPFKVIEPGKYLVKLRGSKDLHLWRYGDKVWRNNAGKQIGATQVTYYVNVEKLK